MSDSENSGTGTGPLTVIATWRVRQGREQEFEAWRHKIAAAATSFPGHLGVEVIRPRGPGREYVVIFRFDTYDHLRAWQDSGIRLEMLMQAEPYRERAPSYRIESGLEFWFTTPGLPMQPPRWKMALVTALGVWPVSMLVPWLLMPGIRGLPPTMQALVISAGIVILLTWAVMPVLSRLLGFWLVKTEGDR